MANSQLPVPEKLNFEDGREAAAWRRFKRQWTNYELATGLKSKPKDIRLATFLNIIGNQGFEKYDSFTFSNPED